MSTASNWTVAPEPVFPRDWTMADLQAHLGGVPAGRIRLFPAPGTATEDDALSIAAHEDRLCELVDGILVEKPIATFESYLAGILLHLIHVYLENNSRGIALPPDGTLRILPEKMRIPDVSFISWDRFPNRTLPTDRVYRVAPDLAVEILSEGNTEGEMSLKLDEYFQAGVRLVWYIDPRSRSARIYTIQRGMRCKSSTSEATSTATTCSPASSSAWASCSSAPSRKRVEENRLAVDAGRREQCFGVRVFA